MASNPEQAGQHGSSPGTTPPASRDGTYIPPAAARRAVGSPATSHAAATQGLDE